MRGYGPDFRSIAARMLKARSYRYRGPQQKRAVEEPEKVLAPDTSRPAEPREFERYMKREEHGALFVVMPVAVGESDTVPLLSAPQGGATILRLRIMPRASYAISGSDYWVLSLVIYGIDGTEKRTIPLVNCGLNVLPFTKYKTMIWPPTGRFDERLTEGETVHLKIATTGSPGTDYFTAQLDYLLAGR